MNKKGIRDKCHVNTNFDCDTFVGIRAIDGDLSINFPLGYSLSENDKELRSDILLLFETLASYTSRMDSELQMNMKSEELVIFPMQAYIYLIGDYFARGVYKEREVSYKVSNKGKINWKRTIGTQRAFEQNGNLFYLNFVTKNNTIRENELITLIHEYLIYESFDKIGWLFTNYMPEKSGIKYNKKLFTSVILDKLQNTFNDSNKTLFANMLRIINYLGDKSSSKNFKYGTTRFEYVWEKMVDKIYGIQKKEDYFPRTFWRVDGAIEKNAVLEPDTIMLYNRDVYILDAKYYKYGYTKRTSDLPGSTSINKQITYGEFVQKKIVNEETQTVYNAFIMPFDSKKGKTIESIGEAFSSWKYNNKSYEKVVGILVDVKKLMRNVVSQDASEIRNMANTISEELQK